MKNVNLLMVFPGNDFPVFLITKCFILDVKEFLDSPLHLIHYTCKNSQLIILIVFKSKIQKFFLFFKKKNACFVFYVIIMVITSMLCFSSFLTISYRFPWCSRMFFLLFLRFPWVFLLCFPCFLFRFCNLIRCNILILKINFHVLN